MNLNDIHKSEVNKCKSKEYVAHYVYIHRFKSITHLRILRGSQGDLQKYTSQKK